MEHADYHFYRNLKKKRACFMRRIVRWSPKLHTRVCMCQLSGMASPLVAQIAPLLSNARIGFLHRLTRPLTMMNRSRKPFREKVKITTTTTSSATVGGDNEFRRLIWIWCCRVSSIRGYCVVRHAEDVSSELSGTVDYEFQPKKSQYGQVC